jgi:type VI secretion system protein ImpA
MATIDVDKYLEPISDESPCGENLEYDLAFTELERLARGKPGRQEGDKEVPPEPPNWHEVFSAAEALMERTRDLRVVVYLTHAALNTDGLREFSSGLRLIYGLLQSFWESVYPMLDKEDNDDPTARVNSLAALNAHDGVVRSLIRVPLVESRAAGRFSLRDMRLASGELTPVDEEEVPDAALIDAAFMDCDLDTMKATADAVKEAVAAIDLMDAYLRERVGAESAPDFGLVKAELAAMQVVLAEQLGRRGVSSAAGEGAEGASDPARAGHGGALGQINTREDVVRALDRATEYFRKHEPSSPVPLLLQRAKRLVHKDFMEILRDLTPDAVSQAELIGGLDREE